MVSRLNLLPEERFSALGPAVSERLSAIATQLHDQNFGDLFDSTIRYILENGIRNSGADEGTLWMLDQQRENLVPVFNNGPRAADFVGSFRQPLGAGMISLVAVSEQPLCENEVYRNSRQDKRLDTALQLRTCAMLAVPFHCARELRGVFSCVKLRAAGSAQADPEGFTTGDLQICQQTAEAASRLVESRIINILFGRESC